MKGLLIKDWKTLLKQMKVMLVIVVVFVCIPGTYMAAFALFYAAMWDELAAMISSTPLMRSVRRYCGMKRGITSTSWHGSEIVRSAFPICRLKSWNSFRSVTSILWRNNPLAFLITGCISTMTSWQKP